jgi:hypothetical protein
MKILVITNYFYPFNHSGSIRWTWLGRFIPFDVLTQIFPRKSFIDETLPYPFKTKNVYKLGFMFPAVIWGLVASFAVLFFRKYDIYIFTSPPQSLLLGAYFLQKSGKRVVVDMRDSNNSWGQRHRWLVPLYDWLYDRLDNVVVVMKFLDSSKKIIYSGYDDVTRFCEADKWEFVKPERLFYRSYLELLSKGKIPDYRNRNDKPKSYGCSSYVTLRKMGFEGLPNNYFHDEVYTRPITSWQEASEQYKTFLEHV